jgi:glucose/arabinose dehydrogenase
MDRSVATRDLGHLIERGENYGPQRQGSGFISGLASQSLVRIIFDGRGGAKPAERWKVGRRIRDVEEGPDGSLWMLEDGSPGALIHVTPEAATPAP